MASKLAPHVKIALGYARDVVKGAIPACGWVRKACQRQLSDLERWKGSGSPYYFDQEAAELVCRFVELMPHGARAEKLAAAIDAAVCASVAGE